MVICAAMLRSGVFRGALWWVRVSKHLVTSGAGEAVVRSSVR